MLFGITGAHRAGKTTLARRVADELGINFYATDTTGVARSLGFDPVAPMTLERRVVLQIALLNHHVERIKALPRPLIVDRTPADYLAYMLCEVGMNSDQAISSEYLGHIQVFTDLALDALRIYYDRIFILKPLPVYAVEAGKPPPNIPFQTHFALMIEGILSHCGDQMLYYIMRSTNLEARAGYVHDRIVERLDEIGRLRASAAHVH